MRVFKITDPVYHTEPLIIMGCSWEEMRAYANKRFHLKIGECEDGVCGSVLTFDRAPWRLLWLKHSTDLGEIAHEVFHLTTRIMQDRGIQILAHHPDGKCGDEPAAYFFEFLFLAVLKGRRNKRKISA